MKQPMLELTELTLSNKPMSDIKFPQGGDQNSIVESPLLVNMEQIVSVAEKEMQINSTLIVGAVNYQKVRFMTMTNLRTAHIKDTLPEIAWKIRLLLGVDPNDTIAPPPSSDA